MFSHSDMRHIFHFFRFDMLRIFLEELKTKSRKKLSNRTSVTSLLPLQLLLLQPSLPLQLQLLQLQFGQISKDRFITLSAHVK